MLTTDEMKEFRNAPQYIDANTLAQSGVVQKVEEVLYVPYLYANDPSDVIPYPNYYMYGGAQGKGADANTIANATQCIFPQDVVLGDIYLLSAQGSGSEADYRRAAQHYYNFFNSDKGGTLRQNYYGMLRMRDADTKQYYLSTNAWVTMFYNNLNATSQELRSLSASLNRDMPVMMDRANGVLDNTQQLTAHLSAIDIATMTAKVNQTLENVEQMTRKLNSKEGTLGLLMQDATLYNNLTTTVADADSLMRDLKAHPKRYVHFSVFGKKDK